MIKIPRDGHKFVLEAKDLITAKVSSRYIADYVSFSTNLIASSTTVAFVNRSSFVA
jgi:hypothetical protein